MNFTIEDFLASGALLSLDEESVLVGWGKASRKNAPDTSNPTFYFPDFFLRDQKPYFTYENTAVIPKNSLVHANRQTLSKNWNPLGEQHFCQGKKILKDFHLKKWVPYLFYQTGSTLCLQSALSQAAQSRGLYLFGQWENGAGKLGATPELLFHREGTELQAMACAGTGRGPWIEKEAKICREHQLVIEGIQKSLEIFGTSTIGNTCAKSFGPLYHLVTPICAAVSEKTSFETLIRALHPTPALGAYPKKEGEKALLAYDQLLPRGGFGAPAGAIIGSVCHVVVAIRALEWNQSSIRIPIGCGILEESDMDQELEETRLKLEAVVATFGDEVSKIVEKLALLGVNEWCICPGARNAAFVRYFAERENVFWWPDERAAAFFALGRARRTNSPVAVITTSGTAAAELLPAAMEGYYTNTPLVLVTADRPQRLRESGAPQTCVQTGLFGIYAPTSKTLPEKISRPVHLNISFEEPL